MYLTHSLNSFRNMNRLFDEMNRLFHDANTTNTGTSWPKLNAWSNENGMKLTLELPGVDPNTVELSLVDNKLSISGEFPNHVRGENESCHRNERRAGKFNREITLPYRPDADSVTANGQHGVLTITIPKPEADKPKKIAVSAA